MLTQDKLVFPFNVVNKTGEIINRLGYTTPRLELNNIQQRAMKATGLTDFGDPHYLAGLTALLEAAQKDEINYFGRVLLDKLALQCAETRLEWKETQKQQPEAFATPLKPPLIVTGLPRSGTTFLHRMLAADPTHQAIPKWRLIKPFPPTNGRPDNRYQAVVQTEKMLEKLQPTLISKHQTSADVPEECMLLQTMSFDSMFFYAVAPVFSYLDWFISAEHFTMYEEYATVLHWYQAQDARRLVMKSPSHMSELPALISAIPNALIVQTHRDPVQVFNSVNSLFHSLHTMFMRPYVPEKMVEANFRLIEMFIAQNIAARETLNQQIYDVDYKELVNDPVSTVHKIYRHFGLEWKEENEELLTQYVMANPQRKHGAHQYRSADFGLTDAQIRERFSDYIDKFQL